MLPTVESFDTEATACVPVVAEPKCDKVGRSLMEMRYYLTLCHHDLIIVNYGRNKDHPMLVQVELVLPKQVCRELLYGFAEKPIQPHYQVLEVTVDQMIYDHHEIMIMIVGQGNDKKSPGFHIFS